MAMLLEDAFLPATLTAPPMTDEEFAQFCAEHPDLFFEMTAEGELIVMPPTYSVTGARNSEINKQLGVWAERDSAGITLDSSTGFVLPNGARRSPDASWTPKSEIAKLSPESRNGFWHLCPAFVIELRSNSDRLRVVREKMREYIANGAQLGWLIDPQTRIVEIYRQNREPELLENQESIVGEGPVEGFVLTLRTVWDPIGA
jgi:Uma2 family endonuclease